MATLISIHNSDGCQGSCDARCYDATKLFSLLSDNCHCICGGMNHGKGIDKAISQTAELADQWVEQFTKKNNLFFVEVKLSPSCIQPT